MTFKDAIKLNSFSEYSSGRTKIGQKLKNVIAGRF